MTQPAAGTVSTSISTIGPVPTPEAEQTSSAESAEATPSSPVVPPAKDAAPPSPAPPGEAPPPPPERDDLARRADAIARQEARSRKRDVDYQSRAAAIEAKEKALAAKEKELEEALEDPVKYYLDKGKDPVEVARRFARPETEEQKRIRVLEERDKQREEMAKEERERREQHAAETARHDALRSFVGTITPDECPTLVTEHEAYEIPNIIDDVLGRAASPSTPEDRHAYDLFIEEHGRPPTALQLFRARYSRNPYDDEMRAALEQEAVLRATRRRERGERYKPKPPPESPSESAPAAGPSSISNQHAAVTSSAKPKPLSLEERRAAKRKEIVRELEGEGGES